MSFVYGENPDVPNKSAHRGPEALAYLTLVPERSATINQLRDDLWWGRSIAARSVENMLSATRKVLGGGDTFLTYGVGPPARRRYHLGHDVISDVERLARAHAYAQDISDRRPDLALTALAPQLAHIESPPFRDGHLGHGLAEWAAATRSVERVEDTVVAAGLLAAELHLTEGGGGIACARAAVDQALRACPLHEALVRRAMELAAKAGEREAANSRYVALATYLARDGLEPEPETIDLRSQILGETPPANFDIQSVSQGQRCPAESDRLPARRKGDGRLRQQRRSDSLMTEVPSDPDGGEVSPPAIDTSVAHAARIYDYLLGGVTNFEVDRQVAVHANVDMPGGLDGARANVRGNRAFLGRAVRWLVGEAHVRQLLDIGTGIPNADNVHGIAQQVAPESRIVYVDNDPIVLAHAHALLKSTPQGATAFISGDLRNPQDILQQAEATLDLHEPVALVLVAVLHFIEGEAAHDIVRELVMRLAPGSYLSISHGAADIDAENMARLAARLSERSHETFVWRTHEQVTRFFEGLELVDPGVVLVDRWHPDDTSPPSDRVIPFYGGVARKP